MDYKFEVPPFWDIKDEHYASLQKGMEENLKEIDLIVNNTEDIFANTIEAEQVNY